MALRWAIYGLLGALLMETIVRGASQGWFEAVGAEGGPIECAHYALCGASAVLFAFAGRRSGFPDVFSLLAYGAALGVIREADAFLDNALFRGAYSGEGVNPGWQLDAALKQGGPSSGPAVPPAPLRPGRQA